MLSYPKILTIGALVFLCGCQTKPYIRSEFGSGFGMGSAGYFPSEKLSTADAQVREKLIEITEDKNAECVIRFDGSDILVTTFTKRPLSHEQMNQVLRHAEKVKQQNWVSPPPKRMN